MARGVPGKACDLGLGDSHSESCRLTANRAPGSWDKSPLVEQYGWCITVSTSVHPWHLWIYVFIDVLGAVPLGPRGHFLPAGNLEEKV